MEHLDHVAYYGSRQIGLDAAYMSEFESVMRQVCESPLRFPVVREPGIRSVFLRRSPIRNLFRQLNDQVQILAVAHKRRRPNYWIARS